MPGLWASRSFDAVDPPVAVLVIDDDEALGTAPAAALYAYGCRAYLVEGGMAAFQISQAWTPRVIVLDIEMSRLRRFHCRRSNARDDKILFSPIRRPYIPSGR